MSSVRPDLLNTQKSRLVEAVANAIERLHKVRFEDKSVQELLQDTPFLEDGSQKAWGGSHDGYSQDMYEFLVRFVAQHQKRDIFLSTIERAADGMRIQSTQSADQEVIFTEQNLITISETVALSHNGLEPCNNLVRRMRSDDLTSEPQYELAPTIDWEMAEFMPFTFEYAWKDARLGSSKIHLDGYMLFKRGTRHLIPADE